MRCSVGTVKSQASRALAKLRRSPDLAGYSLAGGIGAPQMTPDHDAGDRLREAFARSAETYEASPAPVGGILAAGRRRRRRRRRAAVLVTAASVLAIGFLSVPRHGHTTRPVPEPPASVAPPSAAVTRAPVARGVLDGTAWSVTLEFHPVLPAGFVVPSYNLPDGFPMPKEDPTSLLCQRMVIGGVRVDHQGGPWSDCDTVKGAHDPAGSGEEALWGMHDKGTERFPAVRRQGLLGRGPGCGHPVRRQRPAGPSGAVSPVRVTVPGPSPSLRGRPSPRSTSTTPATTGSATRPSGAEQAPGPPTGDGLGAAGASAHVDRHRDGLEDGRQLGGVDLQDLAVVGLAGGRQHLLVDGPLPVGVDGDGVDAEVVVVGQVQRLAGVRGGDALDLVVREEAAARVELGSPASRRRGTAASARR